MSNAYEMDEDKIEAATEGARKLPSMADADLTKSLATFLRSNLDDLWDVTVDAGDGDSGYPDDSDPDYVRLVYSLASSKWGFGCPIQGWVHAAWPECWSFTGEETEHWLTDNGFVDPESDSYSEDLDELMGDDDVMEQMHAERRNEIARLAKDPEIGDDRFISEVGCRDAVGNVRDGAAEWIENVERDAELEMENELEERAREREDESEDEDEDEEADVYSGPCP